MSLTHKSMLGACPVLELELGSWQMTYIRAEVKVEQKSRILWRKLVCRNNRNRQKRRFTWEESLEWAKGIGRLLLNSSFTVFSRVYSFFFWGSLRVFFFLENTRYSQNMDLPFKIWTVVSVPARLIMPKFTMLDEMVSIGHYFLTISYIWVVV